MVAANSFLPHIEQTMLWKRLHFTVVNGLKRYGPFFLFLASHQDGCLSSYDSNKMCVHLICVVFVFTCAQRCQPYRDLYVRTYEKKNRTYSTYEKYFLESVLVQNCTKCFRTYRTVHEFVRNDSYMLFCAYVRTFFLYD